jgi:hypothetical protein
VQTSCLASNWLPLLAGLAFVLSGCGGGQAHNVRLLKQWSAHCKEAADLLAGVKDVASAKATLPRLKAALQAMDEVGAQLEESYDPTEVDPWDGSAVDEPAAQGIVEMQRLAAESVRIAKDPEIKAALAEIWPRLSMGGILDNPAMGE